MGGNPLIAAQEASINDAGELLLTDEEGNCQDCCETACIIGLCGGGVYSTGMSVSDMRFPFVISKPDFIHRRGLAMRGESDHAHATNVSNCDQDQFTTYHFACNGDGTGTLTVKQYAYTGNSPDIPMPKTTWRVISYRTGTPGDQLSDAWPLLDCLFDSYNPQTGVLTVDAKWGDYLSNNRWTLQVSSQDENFYTIFNNPTFTSYTGPGTATAENYSYFTRITVNDAVVEGGGPASGTAVFDIPNHADMRYIVLLLKTGVDSEILVRVGADYFHYLLGSDSAVLPFSSTQKSCGYCSEGVETEIEFDTGVSTWKMLAVSLPQDWYGRPYSEQYWCGCYPNPRLNDALSTYSVIARRDSDSFYVSNAEGTTQLLSFTDDTYYPLNSNFGGQLGYDLGPGTITRRLTQEKDQDGEYLEQGIAYQISGVDLIPLMDHAGHDNPYPAASVVNRQYNEYTRLGIWKAMAAAPQNNHPTYTVNPGGNQTTTITAQFNLRIHGDGEDYNTNTTVAILWGANSNFDRNGGQAILAGSITSSYPEDNKQRVQLFGANSWLGIGFFGNSFNTVTNLGQEHSFKVVIKHLGGQAGDNGDQALVTIDYYFDDAVIYSDSRAQIGNYEHVAANWFNCMGMYPVISDIPSRATEWVAGQGRVWKVPFKQRETFSVSGLSIKWEDS